MSKIGSQVIVLPNGVSAMVSKENVVVKGPKGELTTLIPNTIKVQLNENKLSVSRDNNEPGTRGLHGLTRALIANTVTGVTEGYTKNLELKGVGYRAEIQGQNLVLNVGFSHPVSVTIPLGVESRVEKNQIIISGIDKQLIGQFAATVRRIKPPEPYKGKGIRYVGEIVKIKPGKQAAKTAA